MNCSLTPNSSSITHSTESPMSNVESVATSCRHDSQYYLLVTDLLCTTLKKGCRLAFDRMNIAGTVWAINSWSGLLNWTCYWNVSSWRTYTEVHLKSNVIIYKWHTRWLQTEGISKVSSPGSPLGSAEKKKKKLYAQFTSLCPLFCHPWATDE